MSEETKLKISKNRKGVIPNRIYEKGNPGYWLGKKRDPSTLQKISETFAKKAIDKGVLPKSLRAPKKEKGPRKRVLCLNNGKIYKNSVEAAKDLNLKSQSIAVVAHGQRASVFGFKFKYLEKNNA